MKPVTVQWIGIETVAIGCRVCNEMVELPVTALNRLHGAICPSCKQSLLRPNERFAVQLVIEADDERTKPRQGDR